MGKTRRSPGEGSLYRRKDGRWAGSAIALDGSRRTVYGRTKVQALARLEALKVKVAIGEAQPARMTVGELIERFLEAWKVRVRPTTWHQYDRTLRLHAATLWRMPLSRLTTLTLDTFMTRQAAAGTSPSTLRHLRVILGIACQAAVRWRLLPSNPVPDTLNPRVSPPRTACWTLDEVRAFLVTAPRLCPWWSLYVVALACGLRRGELAGARVAALDLGAGHLEVRHARIPIKGGVVETEPKTPRARRLVPIPSDVVPVLDAWMALRAAWAAQADGGWRDGGCVWCWQDGTPLHPESIRRMLRRVAKAADVRVIRIHDLRHTHAVLQLRAGAALTGLSRRLGHASPAFTLAVYADHLEGDSGPEAVAMLSLPPGNAVPTS